MYSSTHMVCGFVSLTCQSHLLQQFVSFCLKHEGEIIALRRLQGMKSFLFLQVSYDL